MPCCGTAKDKDEKENEKAQEQNQPGVNGFQPSISTQPSPIPGLSEKLDHPHFVQPTLSPPPHAHTSPEIGGYNPFGQVSSPPPQSWNHSPSPPLPNGAYNPAQRQTSVYGSQGFSSPPLSSPSPALTSSGPRMSIYSPGPALSATPIQREFTGTSAFPADEGKMSVSIDFGTTFSGVAFGSSRIAGGAVQQILHWPGSDETFRKVPTCLLYNEIGHVIAWGLEAKNSAPMPGTFKCEWFKLFLEPRALRDESAVDPRLPALPPGKTAYELIVDFLSSLWEYAKQQITTDIGAIADLDSAEVWLTVPAAWDAKGCDMMRAAAIHAGLVQSSRAGEQNWKERLKIITEPEAAAVHCAHLTNLHKLKPSQTFMIVDAGGGTVDLAVYRIIGEMQHLEIAEVCARSGANCGSIFLDLRFRELVKTLLADHPAHLDAASLANFMHSFQEVDKLAYMGVPDDDTMFHFTCFSTEDPHDPSVGLINGELAIPGNLLRREVFDPVVGQVTELIEEQAKKIDRKIDAILLVGGFSQSEYLLSRVKEQFGSRINVIARPSDADTATLRGAAKYGLARRPLVSSVIAPRSYIMKVKLPAEQIDWQQRPAYIRTNPAGVSICENRLQFLVSKGAILRKGQRITTKFCKYSATAQDSQFLAVLYTSDSDRMYRYTDEGETTELCKWQVDLTSLPSFQQNAATRPSNGFYTEFELGLELDSAEVRGILLWEGQECGRVVFDFFN